MPKNELAFGSNTRLRGDALLPQRENGTCDNSRFGENKKSGIAAALCISTIL